MLAFGIVMCLILAIVWSALESVLSIIHGYQAQRWSFVFLGLTGLVVLAGFVFYATRDYTLAAAVVNLVVQYVAVKKADEPYVTVEPEPEVVEPPHVGYSD